MANISTSSAAIHEPFVRLVKREGMGVIPRAMVRVIAIVLALVVDALFIYFVTGLNPLDVYGVMFEGTFGTPARFVVVIGDVMTLLIVGIALAPAFKMRFWNIGAEGQILMGALMSGLCMKYLYTLPNLAIIFIMMISSVLVGAVWAFVPAFFKARWNTNETLFTLMMNYVATQIMACATNIMRGQASSLGTINQVNHLGWFPRILTEAGVEVTRKSNVLLQLFNQYYTINILVVLALVVLMYVYLKYSKQGYEISVVGESQNTARYAGINVRTVTIRTMIISGAICGLAGFLIVSGRDHSISTGSAGGRGFDAIIVAWLAKFNTFIMMLISFLLIFLEHGASEIASVYTLNDYAADIITGIILFFILGCEFFVNYRLVFRKRGVRHLG